MTPTHTDRGLSRPCHRALSGQRVLACSVLAFALFASGCAITPNTGAKSAATGRWGEVRSKMKLQQAQQQYQSGNFTDAARTAAEAIPLDPRDATAYALLAKANLELNRPATAEQTLAAAATVGATSPELRYLRGVILEQRGEPQPALTEYTAARQADGTQVDYLVAEAETLVALDRPAEALALLDANARHYDDDATVAALAAHVAARLGDAGGAADRFGRSLANVEKSIIAAEELGRARVAEGRFDEALALLNPIVSHCEPEACGATRRSAAAAALALGTPVSARDALAKYAAAHPEDTLAQLLLAKAALALGDTMTALRAVDLVGRREPDRPELRLVRAAVQWRRGNLTAAASDLYDYLQIRPDDVEANCLLAEVLRSNRQSDGARAYFKRALTARPDFPWALAGLESLSHPDPDDNRPPTPKLTAVDGIQNGE